jgi:hypothetical protein
MAMLDTSSTSPFPDASLEEDVVFPCKGCGDLLEEGKAFELGEYFLFL